MTITKKYLNDLDTKLLTLAERLEDKADDAGETDEQQERAGALREIAEMLMDAKALLAEWVD